MKRMIFSGCIILIFASMVLVSYGAMIREPISSENLPDLKGKWEGWRTFRGVGTRNFRTELEIYNDAIPLQGKLTFHETQTKGMMSGTIIMKFNTGKINDGGNFILESGGNSWEFSLYKDKGKMKLEGDFYYQGGSGTMILNKE